MRLGPALEALARIADQLEASRLRFDHDRERNLRGLALAVAHQIVQRELATDPSIVNDLVARALELMPASAPVEVRVSPGDLAALSDDLQQLAAAGRPVPVQWLSDPALGPGSFMIESPLRIVDGRTDVALRTLFERLEHA
jgi:flagellar biosynthesis/type III secretory pathway protein FliH